MSKNYAVGSFPGNYDTVRVAAGKEVVEMIKPVSTMIHIEVYTIGKSILRVNNGEKVVLMPAGEYEGQEIYAVSLDDVRIKSIKFEEDTTVLNIGYKCV